MILAQRFITIVVVIASLDGIFGAPPPSPCLSISNCDDCYNYSDGGCGWCPTNNHCYPVYFNYGVAYALNSLAPNQCAVPSSLYPSALINSGNPGTCPTTTTTTATTTTTVNCASITDCADCTYQAACGWCATNNHCYPAANFLGRYYYALWSTAPNQCTPAQGATAFVYGDQGTCTAPTTSTTTTAAPTTAVTTAAPTTVVTTAAPSAPTTGSSSASDTCTMPTTASLVSTSHGDTGVRFHTFCRPDADDGNTHAFWYFTPASSDAAAQSDFQCKCMSRCEQDPNCVAAFICYGVHNFRCNGLNSAANLELIRFIGENPPKAESWKFDKPTVTADA